MNTEQKLREALQKILELEDTESNEWDSLERVIPEIMNLAKQALAEPVVKECLITQPAPDVQELVDSVWAEYEDSAKSKWTFRREHVENAIRATLAKHGVKS